VRPAAPANSFQAFLGAAASMRPISTRREQGQTGTSRLSTVNFRLRPDAPTKLNAINTCAKFSGNSRRISTYDLLDLKPNRISTYEKKRDEAAWMNLPLLKLRVNNRGLILLQNAQEQVPSNDTLAENVGVGWLLQLKL
jgi:hypothetical protein